MEPFREGLRTAHTLSSSHTKKAPMTTKTPRVVVIDDSKLKQAFLKNILAQDYTVFTFSSVKEALPHLESIAPSCFLMDMERPGEDPVSSIQSIRSIPSISEVPIVMITSINDVESEELLLQCGCDDYVGNRFAPKVICSRVTHLVELYGYRKELEKRVEEKMQSVMELQDAIMLMLSDLVECRDTLTSGHARRTRAYASCLMKQMLAEGSYKDQLTNDFVRDLIRAAPLHDVGKVGIPDDILNKPAQLSEVEFEAMKRHTIIGAQAIRHAIMKIHDNSFLKILQDIAFTHHERWDGSGYPLGLREESIPLAGRIMAIPDVYDALVSTRPYKEPFSHEKALSIIKKNIGTHFDPLIGNAFLHCEQQFKEISQTYKDM